MRLNTRAAHSPGEPPPRAAFEEIRRRWLTKLCSVRIAGRRLAHGDGANPSRRVRELRHARESYRLLSYDDLLKPAGQDRHVSYGLRISAANDSSASRVAKAPPPSVAEKTNTNRRTPASEYIPMYSRSDSADANGLSSAHPK
jgi:hypothetical protein